MRNKKNARRRVDFVQLSSEELERIRGGDFLEDVGKAWWDFWNGAGSAIDAVRRGDWDYFR